MTHAPAPVAEDLHSDPPDILAPAGPLSPTQVAAVLRMAEGWTDTRIAGDLGVHRVTVTRWRLYNGNVRAALDRERLARWEADADALSAVRAEAWEVVRRALAGGGPDAVRAALAVLRMGEPPAITSVRAAVDRARERDAFDDAVIDLRVNGRRVRHDEADAG
jgi:hypothetical protein